MQSKECILTIDFGSTFTKVTGIEINGESAEILGTAKAFTTIESDIRDGLNTALERLYATTGEINFSQKLAASSAGGGLKMVAVGLVPALTSKASLMAACSAGAKVVKTFSYEMTTAEADEVFHINPDLVLLSGGTDGGNKAVLLHNAAKLAPVERDFAVIVAGNKVVSEEAAEILAKGNKLVKICENVMPAFGELNILPAKAAIRDLFMEKIIEAKGLGEAAKMMDIPIIPTPLAVYEAALLLSENLGSLIAVDVGGATTDVYSMCDGKPTRRGIVQKGLQEPYAKRSVEGDLGMRYSLEALTDVASPEVLASMAGFETYKQNCLADPSYLPQGEFAEYDRLLCGEAVSIAVERHCGRLERVYTPMGEQYYQYGKDLSEVKYVLGLGGPIVYSHDPQGILTKALASAETAEILKPKSPAFLIDKKYIFAACGLLARVNKAAAVSLMKQEITPIGGKYGT